MRTFGAVVLTLNATGDALWFEIESVRLTTTVRGPTFERGKTTSIASSFWPRGRDLLTVEPQSITRGNDYRHCI